MRRLTLPVFLLLALPALADPPPPEVQLALTSLRPGERARLEKAVGEPGLMPLYRADLELDPVGQTAKGTVVVTYPARKEPLDELYLRLTPNANHDDAVTVVSVSVGGKPVDVERVDDTLVKVPLKPAVKPGELAEVTVKLTARVPNAPRGSTQLATNPNALGDRGGDYGAYSAAPEVVAMPGLLPMVVWEKPSGELASGPSGLGDLGTFEPSNFVVSARVPAGWRVVAPGNQVGEVPEPGGGVRFAFTVAGARDFPLFATRGYGVAKKKVGDVTVESHYFAKDEAAGKVALDHAAEAIRLLDEKLGPYPYTTFRVVEARLANGAGGMEFPGLVTVGAALYRGAQDPLAVLGMPGLRDSPLAALLVMNLAGVLENTLEFIVDHEVAHQYFAMLVGSDCVDEPVVDEALTQHVALLLLEWRKGKDAAESMRDGQLRGAYQVYRLFGGKDRAADRATGEYQTNAEYAGLVYGKAPLLFDAQRELMGDEAWEKALRAYVAEYRYKWAGPKSLAGVAAKVAPGKAKKLERLRLRWFDEKHGDEDVGAFDMEALLSGQVPGMKQADQKMQKDTLKGIDPKLLEEYEKAMRALSGME